MKTQVLLVSSLLLSACTGGSESTRVDVEVVTASLDSNTAITDLGYEVSLTEARLAVSDVLFTTGEKDHSVAQRVWSWIVPSAHAHPGHFGGGEVAGELLGDYILDWNDTASSLGMATMIVGPFTASDFLFRRAENGELGDPSYDGHSVFIAGTARRDGTEYAFDALIRFADGTTVIGAFFDADIEEEPGQRIAIALNNRDPFENDTLFDGIDFAAVASEDDRVEIRPGSPEHNRLDRALQSHDHYLITIDDD